jgi:DNA-binding NarL/FixJ family response regulator
LIKVGIVEDDVLFLHALMGYLGHQPEIELVGCAGDIEEAIQFGTTMKNMDVLLVDCCLEQTIYDGIQVIQSIKSQRKDPLKYIFLTSVEDQDVILKAYVAGAARYILKSNYQELVPVIRSIMNQGPNPMDTLLDEYRRLVEEQMLSPLTTAEREVFTYLRSGRSRTEIVELLGKTEDTVKTQIKAILRKLQVSTTKEALDKIKRGGL